MMLSVLNNPVNPSVNILASASNSARKNARKATTPSRRKATTPSPNSRRARTRENNRESRSRRTDKQRAAMNDLVNRIDWAHCLQCNHNNWDDCVEYAMKAAEHGVIGCEYLKFNDKNDSRDGTVS